VEGNVERVDLNLVDVGGVDAVLVLQLKRPLQGGL
jgi:hypothetical protein